MLFLSDYSGRKGGIFSAIVLLAIGVVLQMIIVGSSAYVIFFCFARCTLLTSYKVFLLLVVLLLVWALVSFPTRKFR